MAHSVRRIIWNDWPALASAIGIPMVLAIAWGIPLLQPVPGGARGFSIGFSVVGVLVCAALLGWRVRRIARLFARGRRVEGVVTALMMSGDRGRLEFFYRLDGREHATWQPVHRTRAVMALAESGRIEVLVDPARPDRAIVKALFARDGGA